jgi:hypothetical protein
MTSRAPNWSEANQRHLMASLAGVRTALERHAATASNTGEPPEAAGTSKVPELPSSLPGQSPFALELAATGFDLTPFERDVLLLAAGMELDSRFAALCARANGDPARAFPTFSLALAALPGAHWSALSPGGPLRRWRLIEIGGGSTLTGSALRIDERVLHHLTGTGCLEDRLQGLVEPVPSPGPLPGTLEALVKRILEAWSASTGSLLRIQLCGQDAGAQTAVAFEAARAAGFRLHRLRAEHIPPGIAERESIMRLWERESVLGRAALLIDCRSGEEGELQRRAAALIDATGGMLLVASREPLREVSHPMMRLSVARPDAPEQRALWEQALGRAGAQLNGALEQLTAQFQFGIEDIRTTALELQDAGERSEPASELGPVLWSACRARARMQLDDLAQRIEPVATWEDLVLPDAQLDVLHTLAAHVRHRFRVYEDWGFSRKGARGLGISALFAGGSGTGKTMAGEVLANELRLDLYRIDLSAVVSKYIGETEKNLRRVFDAAETGGAILLFDEADALFGRRSEVKDSHDRYANIEVSYLLQRMEAYRGLAILTTNQKQALDPAFLRRIRYVDQIPFPDNAQRAGIWRRIFPKETPTRDLDPAKLARLNIAGGNIRNIALNAAFLAADDQQPVAMRHIARAARGEYSKLEKPLTDAEIGAWE